MTFSISAKLRSSNCVPVTHLTPVGLPSYRRCGYPISNATQTVAGDLGGSNLSRRSNAASSCERFFSAHTIRYGGCARDTFGYAGFLDSWSANLRTVAPFRCLAASGDGFEYQGALPMQHPTPRYLFKVSNPTTHDSMTVATESPYKALTVFGKWFRVPTHQAALTRRVPVQEVAQ